VRVPPEHREFARQAETALLAVEPQVLRDLLDARKREDRTAVAGMIDWLEAGL
jgi:ribose 1,5-bisphosphokinase PhnN